MNNENKGIYFIYDKEKLIYVGQTKDLPRRLYQHIIGDWTYKEKEIALVFFIPRVKHSNRMQLEKYFIKDLNPPYNAKQDSIDFMIKYQDWWKKNIYKPVTFEYVKHDYDKIIW